MKTVEQTPGLGCVLELWRGGGERKDRWKENLNVGKVRRFSQWL